MGFKIFFNRDAVKVGALIEEKFLYGWTREKAKARSLVFSKSLV